MDRLELAWAAGFFDGDGWAGLSGALSRAWRQPLAQINQASEAGVPMVLDRFRRAVGVGAIRGPTLVAGRKPMYHWTASSRTDVAVTFDLLRPCLTPRRCAQFARALGLVAPVDRAEEWARDELRAWSAGLFDAEGNVCALKHRTHAGYFVPETSVTQTSRGGVPLELIRFHDAVNVGRIYGPFRQVGARGGVYRWKAATLQAVVDLRDALGPLLSDAKSEQLKRVLDVITPQSALPRGNPLWGSHKSHCLRGHEYGTARIRSYRGRRAEGREPRASTQCLICAREQASLRRLNRKLGGPDRPPSLSEHAAIYLLK